MRYAMFSGKSLLVQLFISIHIIENSHLSEIFESLSVLENILPVELQQCTRVILDKEKNRNFVKVRRKLKSDYFNHDRYIISLDVISHENLSSFSFNPTQVKDIQKLRKSCGLAYIPVDSEQNGLNSDSLYNLLNDLSRILRNDRDYFIFYSGSKSTTVLDLIFTKGPVAAYVKNKIGIHFTPTKNQDFSVQFITTCFYCGHGNTPNLVRLQTEDISFPDYLTNFHGKTLLVSCATLTGWLTGIREVSPGKYIAVRGLLKFSFDYLSTKFNFSGDFFPSTGGGGTGNKYPNGTWAGAVGDVYNGKADLGFPVGGTYKRAQVVNFAFPVSYDWLAFTTGIPQPYYSWKSIYWPLKPLVWGFTMLSSVFTLVILVVMLKVTRNKYSTVSRATTYLYALFLEQDKGAMEQRESSARVLVTFWLIFGMLITTAYRSKLVSLISFPVLEQPPKTFKALAQSSPHDHHITLQYLRGAAYALLKTSTNPTFKNIFQRMELEENDAKCYQRAIGTTRHTCISWANVASYVYNKNLSDASGYAPLVMAPDVSTFLLVSYVFRKEELFKEKFDNVIAKAVAMGLKEKWVELDNEFVRNERSVWEKRENITKVEYEDAGATKALKMAHLLGTFFVLGAGSLIALVSVMGEVIYGRFLHRVIN